MKTLSYTWKVIVNIISIIIITSIFSIASTKFESVVLSALVLIYLNICSFTALWGLHQVEFSEALDKELKDIKKLIKNPERDLEAEKRYEARNALGFNQDFFSLLPNLLPPKKTEKEIEAEKERVENKKTLMVKFYINAGFQILIYIITLFNLLKVLNS